MLLDFNKYLKDLDGVETENPNTHIGKGLANTLVAQSEGDAIKYWGWALKLNNKESIDVDESDYNTLKEFIKSNKNTTILFKAQLLEILGSEFKK